MLAEYIKRLVFCFLASMLVSLNAYAYNRPQIINFSKDKYHADNKNWSIGQDEKNVMYFGNDNGLLEFDGIEWKLNSMSNSLVIRSVAVKSHQTIFTGSYEEFGRWDRDISGSLTYTSLSKTLDKSLWKNDDFWKIWILDNLVYFQSFNSIYVYDYKTVKRLNLNKTFLFLSKVRNEFLIQEMRGPLFRLQADSISIIPSSERFIDHDIRVILPYGTHQYLIGTATKGVYIYDGLTFTEWNTALSNILKSKELNSGIYTKNGLYYFGTILDGIYVADSKGNVIDHLSSNNMLQNNTVLGLFEDKSGNIWAGLDRGISYIRHINSMSAFTDPSGYTGSVYASILWNEKLLIGTNQGIFYISKENLEKTNPLSRMTLIEGTQGQVWSFKIIDNKLYCAHNRGLMLIQDNMKVLLDPYKLNIGVYNLAEATIKGEDVLLFSTYSSLRMLKKKTGQVLVLDQLSEPITRAEVDHLGNIWLEHANKGVYKCVLDNKMEKLENIQYYGGDTLPYRLRIFKVGGRIELLGDNKFYIYDDIKNRIVENDALDECFKTIRGLEKIIHIQHDLYWALTNTAIYKFKYDGYNTKIIESHDIAGNNFSLVNGYENISILNDSLNMICLDNGFLLYNSMDGQKDISNLTLNKPYLQSFKISNDNGNSKYLSLEGEHEIAFNSKTITIRFLGENTLSENLSFQYMLEGVDIDWSEAKKINQLTYARLPKGDYIFKIRTVDGMGNYSDATIYKFEILPPWYESAWAYSLYIILFLSLSITAWYMTIRHYKRLHQKRIRIWESEQLKLKNEDLESQIEKKNAELFTQASFFIRKNEILLNLKNIVEDFYTRNKTQQILPLYHKINQLLNNNLNTEEDWKTFLIKFEEKHTGFFKKMKTTYPDLTSSDLRLCACLKLNLDTKDIASLMNLSVRAVENSRYRLRKKLNIQSSQNLSDFFINID